MTLENRMIKEAKSKPDAVWIRSCDVPKVAARLKNSVDTSALNFEQSCDAIKAGKVRLLGVPIKVYGF